MATVDPPGGPDSAARCNAQLVQRFALMTNGPRPGAKSSSRAIDPLGLASELGSRLQRVNDGDYLIAAQELHACFSVQVPTTSKGVGAFHVLCRFSAGQVVTFKYAGVAQSTLDKEVKAMTSDPQRGEEILDQERDPEPLFLGMLGLHLTRAAVATRHVSAAAHAVAQAVSHRAKRAAAVPRPNDANWSHPQQPLLTQMPMNGSLPGGHALVYTALAEVLAEVSRGGKARNSAALRHLSDRLAENREKALVHTRTDTKVGKQLGEWLAEQLVALAADPSKPCPRWTELFELARGEWV